MLRKIQVYLAVPGQDQNANINIGMVWHRNCTNVLYTGYGAVKCVHAGPAC